MATSANDFENIYVGEVMKVIPHPNADRLRVISVSLGDRVIEPIVCGAFNFESGDKVALAIPGARIAKNIHRGHLKTRF
ncbi:MAG: hypothetical protein HY397_01945 [Candidatus Doudnabacteria bacterium]|nr:hypothetical protein [Candidatus Doudnabacteria bacterium]